MGKWLRDNWAELSLAGLALLVYAAGIGWGWPDGAGADRVRAWGHDDIMPLGPLTELRNTFVHAAPDRFLNYPLMQYLVVGCAYAPYLLYLVISGGISQPGPVFPYGLRDPEQTFQVLTLIARLVTLLMAAGIVFAACQLGRSFWNRRTGIVAGIFVMVLYPMFYYSRTGNLDVPYLFWAAIGMVALARIVRDDFTVRRGIALGVAAACAAGTKDQAAGIFLLLPLVLLPLHLRRMRPGRHLWTRETWLAPAATVTAGALAYLVTSGFVFRPERYVAHVVHITTLVGFPSHPPTLEGYAGLAREVVSLLADGMGLPMLLLSAAAIGIAASRDRLGLALLVPAAGALAFFVVPLRFAEPRFLMPVMFVLACLAASPLGNAIGSARRTVRVAAATAVGLICFIPALQGIELTYGMLRDSRYEAARWLDQQARPGIRIGFFGAGNHLPRIRPDLEYVRVDRFAGIEHNVRHTPDDIREMGALVAEKAPDFVLVIPDSSATPALPHGQTVPPELYRQLGDGSLGYRRAARFRTPHLMPFLSLPDVLDHCEVVNPPVDIFERIASGGPQNAATPVIMPDLQPRARDAVW